MKKVSVGENGGGGGGRERKLGRGSDSQQYSYTVYFFKCDGDAKGMQGTTVKMVYEFRIITDVQKSSQELNKSERKWFKKSTKNKTVSLK